MRAWPQRLVGGFSARDVRREGANSLPEHKTADRRFGSERRLHRRKDFATVLSRGNRLNLKFVTIVVRPNRANHPRLGLAVPRRVARRAVVRHRLKRHIRESFRHHTEHLTGLDVVVLANAGADKMDARRLRGLLARGWDRAAGIGRRNEIRRQAREPHDGN